MVKQYDRTRQYHQFQRQITQPEQEPDQPFWKSAPVMVLGALSILSLAIFLLWEYLTPRIVHIRADDTSKSALEFAPERQQHCKIATEHYKSGDQVISLSFADQPGTSERISIFNTLAVLGQCQEDSPQTQNQEPGTSLEFLLKQIQAESKRQRQKNNLPVVITILVQTNEPGTFHQDNLETIKQLTHEILSDKSLIALMVEDPSLQNQLSDLFASEAQLEVCSFRDIKSCLDWAFKTGRHL